MRWVDGRVNSRIYMAWDASEIVDRSSPSAWTDLREVGLGGAELPRVDGRALLRYRVRLLEAAITMSSRPSRRAATPTPECEIAQCTNRSSTYVGTTNSVTLEPSIDQTLTKCGAIRISRC